MTSLHDSRETTLGATRETSRSDVDPRGDGGAEDALARQLVKRALFPRRADPVRIGRFTVLARVGRGGMGVVYACYDDLLDRKVAVKLLHADATSAHASARLQREAQALARLSHPNVVAIHDVGTVADRVYLAMEFVDGQTLGAWVKAAPRGWREVLRVILAAGEGLAAAHAKGLVHRDIKPDNLMIDADGRVRVMDFGLACAGRETTDSRPTLALSPAATDREIDLTRTGALMGTPAYMAGEQFLGDPTDERTDQFALCATAWEALYGQPAFAGDTLTALAGNVTAGHITPPPARSAVPVWLRRVLQRGLRARPDERFTDIGALLLALRADPTRRRRILGVAAGLVALTLAGLGAREAVVQRRLAACDAAGAQILADWDDAARARLERSFLATGKPYAATTFTRTVPWFDRWTAAWQTATTSACVAHTVDKTWDADLRARADDCLDEARGNFTALVDELADADDGSLARATSAAAELPAPQACTQPEALRLRPMMQPGQRREVLAVRAALARAASLESAGDYQQGRVVADEAVRAAQATGWAPLLAQAELRSAALAERSGDYAGAEATLLRALATAREANAPALALTAAIDMVFVVGYRSSRPAEGKVWAESARTQLMLLGGDHSLGRSDLENNLASVLYTAGEYDEAAQLYEQALALRIATLGADHPRVADNLNNLASAALTRGKYPEAIDLFTRAQALYEATLGPDHPQVATGLSNLALAQESTGNYAAAIPLLTRAIAIREVALGPAHPQLAAAIANLALVHEGLGDYAAAGRLFERALAIQEQSLGPNHTQVADCLHNLATVRFATGDLDEAARLFTRTLAIYDAGATRDHPASANTIASLARIHFVRGEYDEAVRLYKRAQAIHEATLGVDHPTVVHELIGLGETYTAMGQPALAVPLLERALRICEASDVPPDILADTRFALARALGRTPAGRARTLAEQALAGLAAAPASTDKQLEIRRWLADAAP